VGFPSAVQDGSEISVFWLLESTYWNVNHIGSSKDRSAVNTRPGPHHLWCLAWGRVSSLRSALTSTGAGQKSSAEVSHTNHRSACHPPQPCEHRGARLATHPTDGWVQRSCDILKDLLGAHFLHVSAVLCTCVRCSKASQSPCLFLRSGNLEFYKMPILQAQKGKWGCDSDRWPSSDPMAPDSKDKKWNTNKKGASWIIFLHICMCVYRHTENTHGNGGF
jgi:hypothetical protein